MKPPLLRIGTIRIKKKIFIIASISTYTLIQSWKNSSHMICQFHLWRHRQPMERKVKIIPISLQRILTIRIMVMFITTIIKTIVVIGEIFQKLVSSRNLDIRIDIALENSSNGIFFGIFPVFRFFISVPYAVRNQNFFLTA